MITQNNPQYSPLISTIVNDRNWASGVQDLARGWASDWLTFVDALNPEGSSSIEGPDGTLKVAYKPRQEAVGVVQAVAQAGANLVITFTDPTLSVFRTKFMVRDSSGFTGYVISNAPGTITIQPATNPLVLDSTLHFIAGRSVLEMGSGSGNFYSTGVTNLYEQVLTRTNYSAVIRESQTVSRREKFISYKFNETYYSYQQAEVEMLKRFMKKKVLNMLYSEPGQFNSVIEGEVNRYEGLRAAVRNQGGRFISAPALFTTTDFESDLDFMATHDPAQYQNYVLLIGRKAWSRLNTLYGGTNIQYTVSKAVVNGNELNFDIPQVTINGVTMKCMIMSIFDDIYSFPTISTVAGAGYKESNTYCMLNLNPVPNVNGGGLIPSVRKFYFASSNATGGLETLYRYNPGMVGPGASNGTGGGMMGQYQFAGSSIDGGAYEILEDCGVDFTGDACVWRELSE